MQIQDAGTAFRWHPDRSVQVNGITVVPGSQEINNELRVGSFRDLYGKYVREAPLASIRPGSQTINREPRARPHSVVNEHYSDTGDEVESSMSRQPRLNTPRVVNEKDRESSPEVPLASIRPRFQPINHEPRVAPSGAKDNNDLESSPDVPLASIRPYVQPINHEPEPNQSGLVGKNPTKKVEKVDASINRDVEMIDHMMSIRAAPSTKAWQCVSLENNQVSVKPS
jgi:hypothetical protein